MTIQTTYSALRAHLAAFWDRVAEDNEVLIIERKGHRPLALIPADELRGLEETAHLLRSPANAERLLTAHRRALAQTGTPMSLDDLKREVGLEPAD